MPRYIVEGGKSLKGEVSISGSKNASLPIIAASILNNGITKLYNVPNIHDTKIALKILRNLGCKIATKNGKIVVESKNMKNHEIPDDLMRQMRSSVIFAGAFLARFKKAVFSYPGGCDIGSRPIDLHLNALRKLGVLIEENDGKIICKCDEIIGTTIHLDFPSVGATENTILASVFAKGETVLTNCAMEPEIIDLQNFLNKMGAKIEGAGTKTIRIIGVKKLKDVSYNIMPDRIEAGTFLCMAAATSGEIEIINVVPEHILPILNKLEECGCKYDVYKNKIRMQSPKRLRAVDIKTMPYPGFPTDMQSVFTSMLCIAKGTSIIVENIFENRYRYINELKRMGAKVELEGKIAVVKGVKKLNATSVIATDLRGGAAMVLAGLCAKGTTKINNIEHILRGYENLDKKINKLGGKIRIEN